MDFQLYEIVLLSLSFLGFVLVISIVIFVGCSVLKTKWGFLLLVADLSLTVTAYSLWLVLRFPYNIAICQPLSFFIWPIHFVISYFYGAGKLICLLEIRESWKRYIIWIVTSILCGFFIYQHIVLLWPIISVSSARLSNCHLIEKTNRFFEIFMAIDCTVSIIALALLAFHYGSKFLTLKKMEYFHQQIIKHEYILLSIILLIQVGQLIVVCTIKNLLLAYTWYNCFYMIFTIAITADFIILQRMKQQDELKNNEYITYS